MVLVILVNNLRFKFTAMQKHMITFNYKATLLLFDNMEK